MDPTHFDDPFVNEVHKVREKLLRESGGDLGKLMDRLQAREQEDSSRIVRDLKGFKALLPTGGRPETER